MTTIDVHNLSGPLCSLLGLDEPTGRRWWENRKKLVETETKSMKDLCKGFLHACIPDCNRLASGLRYPDTRVQQHCRRLEGGFGQGAAVGRLNVSSFKKQYFGVTGSWQ